MANTFDGLKAKLEAMGGDEGLELIDGFINLSPEVLSQLHAQGWTGSDIVGLVALITTAAQRDLIDGNTWRGKVTSDSKAAAPPAR